MKVWVTTVDGVIDCAYLSEEDAFKRADAAAVAHVRKDHPGAFVAEDMERWSAEDVERWHSDRFDLCGWTVYVDELDLME